MREETLVKNIVKYKKVLEGMITALVGDFAAAEDLFQETAVIMTRKRAEADENCPFLAWGRAIALNVVRDYRKKMARRKVRVLDEEALERVAGAFQEVGDSVWDARREALRACARKLPDREREVLRCRYEEAVPIERLAAGLATTRGAVDTMLYRIRKALLACVEMRLRRAETT
jgi:RNA polymerase sigma-70 factor (ECF subfamily)